MSKVRTAASLLKRFGLRRTIFYYEHRLIEKELPFSCFSLSLPESDGMWKRAKNHPISFGKIGEQADYWLLIPEGGEIAPEFLAACSIRIAECENRPKVVYTDTIVGGNPSDYPKDAMWHMNVPGVGPARVALFPEYSIETSECVDYFGGALVVDALWAKNCNLQDEESLREFLRHHVFATGEVLHIPRILAKQQDDVQTLEIQHVETKDNKPLVSIIIPNKDHIDVLQTCLESLLSKTTYRNYEILVIENNSEEDATFAYYESLQDPVRVERCPLPWNYSAINNWAVTKTKGELLLFLNNDTEITDGAWLQRMVDYATRDGVGAVGAKLLFPDGTIQHGGVTVGIRGVAGHAYITWPGESIGYLHRLEFPQNVGAVTAACMMVPRKVFDEVGGFDEELKVAFNDTDLCMQIRRAGYRVVMQPQAVLTHFESKSRGRDEQSPEKLARFNQESMRFQRRWFREITIGDPSYNPHLSYENDNFEVGKQWMLP
ncbi:MAG: glycosyltransferase family 2 protein [Lachnospiraceae bacterium]|nr:glycosyltransferase family 2 protein [Lachnospiraceae bacterium]